MKEILLFIDGSVNTKIKIGIGAYLVITDKDVDKSGLKAQ